MLQQSGIIAPAIQDAPDLNGISIHNIENQILSNDQAAQDKIFSCCDAVDLML